jgi:hypothetical protein
MPRMISTSCITGTGFMKCIDEVLGCRVTAARRVIEMEDVFDARIAVSGRERVELAEKLLLDSFVLDSRLDHELAPGEFVQRGARMIRESATSRASAVTLPFST